LKLAYINRNELEGSARLDELKKKMGLTEAI